ncbi:MAG: type II toxin-antitoxin system VapB family antitoxin [Proteobacteria bacterium]|nr:type II toxin-antitoxin system VapB family antitoxin [Pseudomonadota bacterium]
MSLNIKNPKTYKLAQEVAQLTGESMAQAVTTALEERKAKLEKESRFERAWAIANKVAERLHAPGGPKMLEIEDLYDEATGLPK